MLDDRGKANIYLNLKSNFREVLQSNNLLDQHVVIHCKALSAKEAIGDPEHDDYPIIKGREVIVEADFKGAKGQAFSDAFEQKTYKLMDLVDLELNTNKKRASFISSLNAVYRYLGLSDKTVHCKDAEPVECSDHLMNEINFSKKVLLIGLQPRFLHVLSEKRCLRIVDLDQDNIGKVFNNIVVEPESNTADALKWCDMVFATGSTIINGTISRFLEQPKPVVFYGITIAAAGKILGLRTYCRCGN